MYVYLGCAGMDPEEEADVRDLFAEKNLGTFLGSWTGAVDIHDVRMVRITPKDRREQHQEWRPWLQHGALHAALRAQLPQDAAVPGRRGKLGRRAKQVEIELQ